jgi:hypothetical protein
MGQDNGTQRDNQQIADDNQLEYSQRSPRALR